MFEATPMDQSTEKQVKHDVTLWLREHDHAAAQRLMETLYPQVIRIVRNHLPRGMDEQELAQEVFVRFFDRLESYDPFRPLENWMSRLTMNVCLNALRSRRRRPEVNWSDLSDEQRFVLENLSHDESSAEPPFNDAKELLTTLMESLSPADRLVVTMLHIENRTLAEVNALTGWGVTIIKMRAYRARRKLRKALEKLDRQRLKNNL